MKKIRKINGIFGLFVLLIVFLLFFLWQNRPGFARTDIINGQKRIVIVKTSEIKLISQTRGEYSYQVQYLDQRDKTKDYSRKIYQAIKSGLGKNGWKIMDKKTEYNYQIFDFKPKNKDVKEQLKVVVGRQENHGTFFAFDYHW